jgi:hypothetical protein
MTRHFARKIDSLSLVVLFVTLVITAFSVLAVFATPAIAQNPVPLTNQPLVPDAIAPGGLGFTLTVNGAGFVSGSVVNWNGSPRPTTFVSSSQLTATILASDIATASTAAVTVVSPSPGVVVVSNTQFFSIAIAEASASFLPVVTYPSGDGRGYFVAVADVNGDGKVDLIVVNGAGVDGSVAVLLGNGDGTFEYEETYDAGGVQTICVAVADVNGDGKPDLVVANSVSLTIGVLLGNGDGTFQPVVTYNSGGSPFSVAVADVNGDGKADIIVGDASSCYGCSGPGLVGVLLGNGDGTFQPVVTHNSGGYSFETSPTALALADLNGDGKLDIVMTNYCSSACTDPTAEGNASVLLGNGDGTFQPAVIYGSGGFGVSIGALAVADVNGDGKPDLLVANGNCVDGGTCGQGTIGVLVGNGDGTFQPVVLYDTGVDNTTSVAVSDVNGDGKPDLVVTNFCTPGGCTDPGTGSVGVMLGNGDGTFQPAVTYSSGGYWGAFSTAVADVDGNGRPDLLVLNFSSPNGTSVGVLTNIESGSPTTTTLVSSLNPSNYGQTVTFTAAVSSTSGTPTGTVVFSDASTAATLGSATLANGSASLATSSLMAGSHSITAAYQGSSSFAPSTSAVLNEVVNGAATSTSLASSPNPSVFAQSVAFTAAVSSASGTPTGTVIFYNGATALGSATLANGAAAISVSSLAAGSQSITAAYQGSGAFESSVSAPLHQVVNLATTTTSLASTKNPANVNKLVTYLATVISQYGGVAYAGTVTFQDGGATIWISPVGGGNEAGYTTSYPTAGLHSITATYSGNANNAGSMSAVLEEKIGETHFPSATTVTTSGSPSLVGQPVTFTATVTSIDGAIPNGELVRFQDDGTPIGAGTTVGGLATLTTSSLTAKTHTIRAVYSGDGTFSTSNGTVTQVVDKYATTTSVASNLNPSTYGQTITFRATVATTGPNIPTGTVKFGIGSGVLSGGVATLTKTWLKAGSYALTAEYEGDSASAPSTSSVLEQVVNPAATTTTISSSANPSSSGQTVTFTAKVTSSTGVGPSGTITFTAGTTTLGTVAVSVGSISTAALPVGSTKVTATYNGATDFTGSSGSLLQTVN